MRIPVVPSTTISGIALTALAMIGRRANIASSSASPKPSQRAGCTSMSARRSQSATSPTLPAR